MSRISDLIESIKGLIKRRKENIFAENPELIYPTKPTNTREALGDDFDYWNTPLMDLTEECKEIVIWYDRDAVTAYKKAMATFFKYSDNTAEMIKDPIADLEKYVYAWADNKVVTKEDISILQRKVKAMNSWVYNRHIEAVKVSEEFYAKNNSDALVDSTPMKLYEYTTTVAYHRIYALFFKKVNIPQGKPPEWIKRDVSILDRIMVMLDVLDSGYGKTSADVEFTELYRRRQSDLTILVHQYVNSLEWDIATLEIWKKISRTPLNLKLYPKR